MHTAHRMRQSAAPTTTSPRGRLATLAARQCRAFTAQQAFALGMTRAMLRTGIRKGEWHRVAPGIYVTGPEGSALPPDTREMIALLWGGPVSRLTAESGAIACELWPDWRRLDQRVHVRTTRGHNAPPVPWIAPIRTHRDVARERMQQCDNVRIASVTRIILDLGRTHTRYQIAAVMDRARFRGMLDTSELATYLDAHPLEPFTAAPRAALRLHAELCLGTKGREEDAYLAAVIEQRLPVPLVNQVGATPIAGFVFDFVWPEFRLVVEIDGKPHQHEPQRLIDANRDELLAQAGWTVIRIPAWRVRQHLPRLMAELARAMQATG